eukprot:CAMPEP_0177609328 /NCGR_PEP_ID=MMETSP0419_2-20121207/19019_1 /TAXON_ID=582737 /ORGANISM="Tetraselmis sp., Strain GSL018" /LENGTH=416 /DNA_ID=CAMNT_0019104223 /DNA_START=260 /DNA_END=1510 /DNA_ORIENTATION=+
MKFCNQDEDLSLELQNCRLEITRLKGEVAGWELEAEKLKEQVHIRDLHINTLQRELDIHKEALQRLGPEHCYEHCSAKDITTGVTGNQSHEFTEKWSKTREGDNQISGKKVSSDLWPFSAFDSAQNSLITEAVASQNDGNSYHFPTRLNKSQQVIIHTVRDALETLQSELAHSSKQTRVLERKCHKLLADSLDQVALFECGSPCANKDLSTDMVTEENKQSQHLQTLDLGRSSTPKPGNLVPSYDDGRSCFRPASLSVCDTRRASSESAGSSFQDFPLPCQQCSSEMNSFDGPRSSVRAMASRIEHRLRGVSRSSGEGFYDVDSPKCLFSVPELVRSRSRDRLSWVEAIFKELQRCTGGNAEAVLERLREEGSFTRLSDARSAFGVYVCDIFRQDANAIFEVEEAIERVAHGNLNA